MPSDTPLSIFLLLLRLNVPSPNFLARRFSHARFLSNLHADLTLLRRMRVPTEAKGLMEPKDVVVTLGVGEDEDVVVEDAEVVMPDV